MKIINTDYLRCGIIGRVNFLSPLVPWIGFTSSDTIPKVIEKIRETGIMVLFGYAFVQAPR